MHEVFRNIWAAKPGAASFVGVFRCPRYLRHAASHITLTQTELKNDCACITYGQSAGRRLEQQISNVKSIAERWHYFVYFLHDFESFSFPKRFIYLRGIAFSGPYCWNFRKAREFVYFIDPLLCLVASRAAFFAARTLDFVVKFWFVFRYEAVVFRCICVSSFIGRYCAKVSSLSVLPKSYQK